MSDNSTRRRGQLMEAWLHKWSDDRARDIREQKKTEQNKDNTQTTAPKIKSPGM